MEDPAVAFPSIARDAMQGIQGKGLVISTYKLYSELTLIFLSYPPPSRRYIYQGQELCLKHCPSARTLQ